MAKGKTKSRLSLKDRKEKAFEMFLRGYRNADIAREIKVTANTITTYRKEFTDHIESAAIANPHLLDDALRNTIQALAELDEVRRAAWSDYEHSKSMSQRSYFLNTIRNTQVDRAKLFGVLGVKQEYFARVQNTRIVQDKLIAFMTKELCLEDQQKVREFLEVDLAPYMKELGRGDIIEGEVVA